MGCCASSSPVRRRTGWAPQPGAIVGNKYMLGPNIGQGAYSVVHAAWVHDEGVAAPPTSEAPFAIKVVRKATKDEPDLHRDLRNQQADIQQQRDALASQHKMLSGSGAPEAEQTKVTKKIQALDRQLQSVADEIAKHTRPMTLVKIERERDLLLLCHHPTVSRVVEHYETNMHYQFVFPRYGSDLAALIMQTPMRDDPSLRRVCLDALTALAYLETIRICHRDVKPANMLLRTVNGRAVDGIVVADFGLACTLEGTEWHSSQVGSAAYMAPELFCKAGTFKSDVFSVGMSLFKLTSQKLPRRIRSLKEPHQAMQLLFATTKTGTTAAASQSREPRGEDVNTLAALLGSQGGSAVFSSNLSSGGGVRDSGQVDSQEWLYAIDLNDSMFGLMPKSAQDFAKQLLVLVADRPDAAGSLLLPWLQ